MIKFENVSFSYEKGKDIIKELSFEIPDGGKVCFSAASGEGKSTVFRLITGLESPRHGRVNIPEGVRFSAVFQDDRLIPWKTALENVALFAEAEADNAQSADEAAESMLARLGVGEAADMYPKELSGGMARRVALARALCHPFDVLILDEAFTGLDDETKSKCIEVVNSCVEGKILLMASHDAREPEMLGADTFVL